MTKEDTKESLRAEFDLALKNWDFLIFQHNMFENEKRTQLTLISLFGVGFLIALVNILTSSLTSNYKLLGSLIIAATFYFGHILTIRRLSKIYKLQSKTFEGQYKKYCDRSHEIIHKIKKVNK